MGEYRLQRVAAVCGILALLLGPVSFFIPAVPPDADADPQKIASFFADHRGGLLLASYLGGITDVLLLAFVFPLAVWLARRGSSRAAAGAVAVTGAIAATIDLAGVGVMTTLAYLADKQPDPGLARALFDASTVLRTGTANFALGLFMLVLGVATLESGVLARWLGWAAVVLGVVSLGVPALPVGSPLSLIAFLVVTVWLITAAVTMYRDRETQPVVAPSGGARAATA